MNTLLSNDIVLKDVQGASAEAIQAHYDVSNDFYRLWLDESMIYSCALWDGELDLHTAQNKKLDLHLQQSHAHCAEHILDIGCGWGSLLHRAVDHFEVKHATGLTLSKAQFEWNQERAKTGMEIRLESWEDHIPTNSYDAIISIGAFEHFAKPGLKRDEKIKRYRNFFEWCYKNSTENSYLSLQSIIYENFNELEPNNFVKEIFPESDLPRLSEIMEAMQGLYEIVKLRNDREHYAKTLQKWFSNLRQNKENAITIGGEDLYKKYEKYLGIFIIGFYVGTVNLTRFSARKIS